MNQEISHWGQDLEALRKQIEYCAFCPKMCRFACPVSTVRPGESLHPTAKATLLYLFGKGKIPFDEKLAQVFYSCTHCLLSRSCCDHEIEVTLPLEKAKALAIERGLAPEGARRAIESTRNFGNPYGKKHSLRPRDIVPTQFINSKAQVQIFAGCSTLHETPELIEDLARILKAFEIDYVAIYDPPAPCCGGILHDLGDVAGFEEMARATIKNLERAKLIVSPCPHCVHTMKVHYGGLAPLFGNRVQHLTEFMAAIVDQKGSALKGRISSKVFYHDPCFAGRYLGIYDPPRAILKTLCKDGFIEFSQSRDRAECCGGGGGFRHIFPEDAEAIAKRRLSEFFDGEGEILATTCPICQGMFRSITEPASEYECHDVISLLARCL